jgi:phosphate transport system substrate-binding protein
VVPIYEVPGVSTPLSSPARSCRHLPGQGHEVERRGHHRREPRASAFPPRTSRRAPLGRLGTSYIWADYLAKVSPEWSKRVGVATAVNWPVGVGGKGNEGVAGLVKQTPNSIGYVELIYALQNKIAYGAVKNAAGTYLQASIASVTAAAAATEGKMPPDFRVSITNAPGKDVYPIASFTWLLLYESAKDKARSQAMVDFVKWALSDGQRYASDLGYAPLPASVVKMELAALGRIK